LKIEIHEIIDILLLKENDIENLKYQKYMSSGNSWENLNKIKIHI
jgi:hypothetical protein